MEQQSPYNQHPYQQHPFQHQYDQQFGQPPMPPQPQLEPPVEHKSLSAGPSHGMQIALQWAMYILWEFVLFSLSVFLASTIFYYFAHGTASEYQYTVYFFASLLVLVPMAFFADKFYTKHEPAEKHGFASVILVLNAILVFLAILGGVIGIVVSLVTLIVDATSSTNLVIGIVSALIITLLSAALLARIMNPAKFSKYIKWFPIAVVGITLLTSIFAFAGPFKSLISSKTDRLIENNISTVNSAIQTYATDKGKLPNSLDDLSFNNTYEADAKTLVSRGLVTYSKTDSTSSSYSEEYKLCANFKNAKGDGSTDENNLYSVSTNHASGDVCFNLNASTYKYDDYNPITTPNYEYDSPSTYSQ